MKITAINPQIKNDQRVNVMVDKSYFCSLYLSQVIDLKLKVGKSYEPSELETIKKASLFGKLYQKSVNYCLIRPRSHREVADYLKRQVNKNPDFDDSTVIETIINDLKDKKYFDDFKFARFYLESKANRGGISQRQLTYDLHKKGVSSSIIDQVIDQTEFNDIDQLRIVIDKKSGTYSDKSKLTKYLLGRGFRWSDIKNEVELDS